MPDDVGSDLLGMIEATDFFRDSYCKFVFKSVPVVRIHLNPQGSSEG